MNKYCCICERLIDDEDYNREGQNYFCLHCSNNDLVPCTICKTMLDPNRDITFQGPDGDLCCSQECLNVDTEIQKAYDQEIKDIDKEYSNDEE